MKIGAITLTLAFSMAFAFLVLAGMPPASEAGPCPDTLDTDGIGDCVDNCSAKNNVAQTDTNSDGYGNLCDADYDDNNIVGAADLALFKQANGSSPPNPLYDPDIDLDSNAIIGAADLAIFKQLNGFPPGPSGLACAGTIPCP